MKSILKQSNLPFLLLVALLVKSIVLSSPIFDSVAISALSALFGFKLWLDHVKKPDHNQIILKEIEKVNKNAEIKIKQLSDDVSSLKGFVTMPNAASKPKEQFRW